MSWDSCIKSAEFSDSDFSFSPRSLLAAPTRVGMEVMRRTDWDIMVPLAVDTPPGYTAQQEHMEPVCMEQRGHKVPVCMAVLGHQSDMPPVPMQELPAAG
jgi:hypothetical protein